jgi:hypothetical protein
LLKRAADVIAEGDLGKVVDFAIDVNRQKVDLEKELDGAKEHLRGVARKKGSAEVELEGLTGTVTVVFLGLTLKVKKGADLKDLEVNLKPEVFTKLFRKTIEVVPALEADEFTDVLATLTEPERATIKHFIEAVDQTGKVYVPR